MIAQLPSSKQEKINSLIKTVLQSPCRKNLEKIIGILLWATSLVHHVRFLLTSLYRDLYSIPATNYSIAPTEWESFLNLLNDCATITTHNHLHLPIGSRVVEFKHNPISSNSQLPRDVPIERHVWIRLRDPNCDKRRLSDAPKETLLWSEESLLPLLKSIPLNRSTQMTITAAADAFATDEEMGIGGWIKLEDKLFWFSHLWNKQELQPFLDIPKSLQRYISSWEALAQLCILLLVNQKCTIRPGIISIQSGSDNTGAEANINHGFSNTEVLSDIIKLVSLQQIRCNIFLNIHHIPGEKNIDADDLSRGRITRFCPNSRVLIQLVEIFNPRYINTTVQWDPDIHADAKTFFLILSPLVLFRFVLFHFQWSYRFFLSPAAISSIKSAVMFPVTVVKRFLNRNVPYIPLPPDLDDDLDSNTGSWLVPSKPTSSSRSQTVPSNNSVACQTTIHKPSLQTSPRSRPRDYTTQDTRALPPPKFRMKSKPPTFHLGGLDAPVLQPFASRTTTKIVTSDPPGSFRLQQKVYHHQLSSIILPEPHKPPKPKNRWNQTKPKKLSRKSSTTSASPANFFVKSTTHSLPTNISIVSVTA